MTSARAALFVVGLLCVGPTSVRGQELSPVEVGARVRLTLVSTKEPLRGIFGARVGDSVEVQSAAADTGASQRIALRDVRRIEVSEGRHHPVGKSALIGTAVGSGVGALIGALVPLCEPSGGWFDCFLQPTDRAESVGVYALGLGFSGLITGAIVGAIGHEAWAPASLPGWIPAVAVRRSGVVIGLTVPLRR